MTSFTCFNKKISCFSPCWGLIFMFRVNPFWIQLCFFFFISFLGFLALRILNPRNASYKPKNFDLFFMSASAVTVSSMGTVEMEVFSNAQLIIFTILMLVGGEIFISMLGLQFMNTKTKFMKQDQIENQLDLVSVELPSRPNLNSADVDSEIQVLGSVELKYRSIRYLTFVVLGYFLLLHVGGSSSILLYLLLIPSARDVLKKKGIQMETFSIFTTVSSFANCGFIPTNENMIIFQRNSGLLLVVFPLILLGNTLFPPFLRLAIWLLKRFTGRDEFDYMMKYEKEIGYGHLLPGVYCKSLCFTVFCFVLVQLLLFCGLEWNSDALAAMNSYQKIVGGLFQSVNSRHAGESIGDISTLSSAILVLCIVMMYLPPYTAFLPIDGCGGPLPENCKVGHKRMGFVKSLMFSHLSYLAIFVILICITEREKLSNDPLNFNVLNIAFEVVSAYGNVGFSTGYSCQRQLSPDPNCKNAWYGFVGRWSNMGKIIIIIIMFLGRTKKFTMKAGQAWKLR